jgi:hypothetical protein
LICDCGRRVAAHSTLGGGLDVVFFLPGVLIKGGDGMRCARIKSLVLVAVLVASPVLFIGVVRGEEGFIQSSGFESLSSLQKTPAGWNKTVVPKYKDYVEFIWDTETFYKDQMSISIKIHKDHPKDDFIAYNWYTDVLNWEVGKYYELSCWVKGLDLHDPIWICVQCWDEPMTKMLNFSTTQKDYPLIGAFDWKQVGTVFSIPEGTYKVIVRAGIAAPGNNGGQAWFDELYIR